MFYVRLSLDLGVRTRCNSHCCWVGSVPDLAGGEEGIGAEAAEIPQPHGGEQRRRNAARERCSAPASVSGHTCAA